MLLFFIFRFEYLILGPKSYRDFGERGPWSLSCYKELKFTIKQFTGRTLHDPLIQMQNISFWSSGMCRKQNREMVFGFKSDTAVLTFTFHFSCFIVFSSAGHLVCFILVGKVFRKACRILGLEERKWRWVVEQDCHGNLQVNVTWFFAFFFTLH